MAPMNPVVRSVADIHPEPVSRRFGLELKREDFDELGKELDRVDVAERSAEVAGAALRFF